MQVLVISVRKTHKRFSVAHVRLGEIYGDLPCDSDVQPGVAQIKSKWVAREGRLQVSSKVVRV